MEWPVISPPISDAELPVSQIYYRSVCRRPNDPLIVWGTEVDVTVQRQFLRQCNDESPVMVSTAHVLLQAVGRALGRHPEFNRRILGRRVYQYRHANVLMPFSNLRTHETELLLVEHVDTLPVVEIAQHIWGEMQRESCGQEPQRQTRSLHLLRGAVARWGLPVYLWLLNHWNLPLSRRWGREQSAGVYVNCLDFRGAPPMTMYKPSKFPTDTLSLKITLGPAVMKPVAVGKVCEVRPVAPLYVVADHRLVDAVAIGKFVQTLREFFANPAQMNMVAPVAESLCAATV